MILLSLVLALYFQFILDINKKNHFNVNLLESNLLPYDKNYYTFQPHTDFVMTIAHHKCEVQIDKLFLLKAPENMCCFRLLYTVLFWRQKQNERDIL